MERIKERIAVARQAWKTLNSLLKRRRSKIVRDAGIQRFEYTLEAVWKAGQEYLSEMERIQAASPTSVIRASNSTGILNRTQTRTCLKMALDRNLSVHTYNEDLANQMFARLPRYATVMDQWLRALQLRIEPK